METLGCKSVCIYQCGTVLHVKWSEKWFEHSLGTQALTSKIGNLLILQEYCQNQEKLDLTVLRVF